MREFSDQELVRREKAENIRNMGMDPFGQKFERTDFAKDIKEKYKDIPHEEFENMTDTATVAGRIMFIRKMGKASFFTIQDKTEKIQIYISINDIGEEAYNLFKTADLILAEKLLCPLLMFFNGDQWIKSLSKTSFHDPLFKSYPE